MSRKSNLRLKTRARLLAERHDMPTASAEIARDLTQSLRLLYERSAFTVREIAALAGISERRIYKIAEQRKWTARGWRVSRNVARIDPAKAEAIAERTRELMRLSDETEAREAVSVTAARKTLQQERAAVRDLRVHDILCGALAELARQKSDDPRHARAAEAASRLLFRQMQLVASDREGERKSA